MQEVIFHNLGLIAYQDALNYQKKLFDEIVATKLKNRDLPQELQQPTKNHLIFCEHKPVFTLGKSGQIENLLINNETLKKQGIEFFHTNRGGDITFHGPGQIVGYPIFDLDNFFTDIHKYLRFLEEAIIQTLAEYNIQAGRYEGYTGVWLDAEVPHKARKICAMGVHASRWVTMHGFALNVNTNLDYFNLIVPCGITDKAVTSLQKELKQPINIEQVQEILKQKLANLFQFTYASTT